MCKMNIEQVYKREGCAKMHVLFYCYAYEKTIQRIVLSCQAYLNKHPVDVCLGGAPALKEYEV